MDFDLPESVRSRIREELPEARRVRRLLHAQPETKFEEVQTAAFLRQACASAPLILDPPLIGTDVTGRIEGALPGPTILLRADMDALPLQEDAPARPWRSTCPGKAHACGHDGHMAILLGALRVLAASTDILPGTVRFVFQPAEEEIGGGKAMVARGFLDLNPKPDAVFALHGWPGQAAGTVSAAPGATMAAADSFVVRIHGHGAHGAQPQRSKDPVLTAAEAICALQTLASRSVDPLQPFVLSVCSLHGGTTRNVIPAEVQFEGTLRCFDPELRSFVRIRMEEILAGICAANGCHHSLEIIEGYSP